MAGWVGPQHEYNTPCMRAPAFVPLPFKLKGREGGYGAPPPLPLFYSRHKLGIYSSRSRRKTFRAHVPCPALRLRPELGSFGLRFEGMEVVRFFSLAWVNPDSKVWWEQVIHGRSTYCHVAHHAGSPPITG